MDTKKIFRIIKIAIFEISKFLTTFLAVIGLMVSGSLFTVLQSKDLDKTVTLTTSLQEVAKVYKMIYLAIFLLILISFIIVRYVINKRYKDILMYVRNGIVTNLKEI